MEQPATFLPVEPLTAAAFREFGDVIEAGGDAQQFTINEGFAVRHHDLARVDVSAGGGRVGLSIFRARPRTLPMQLSVMERHPLGSQALARYGAWP
jgi:ureidoglycolate lyase